MMVPTISKAMNTEKSTLQSSTGSLLLPPVPRRSIVDGLQSVSLDDVEKRHEHRDRDLSSRRRLSDDLDPANRPRHKGPDSYLSTRHRRPDDRSRSLRTWTPANRWIIRDVLQSRTPSADALPQRAQPNSDDLTMALGSAENPIVIKDDDDIVMADG